MTIAVSKWRERPMAVAARIAIALISLHTAQASAADAVERPYNPPVGSRWIIESDDRTDEVRPEGPRLLSIRMRGELTIDAKLADGFRISYVNREATVEGNAPVMPMARASAKALENVVIRAMTDSSGKPVEVENLDEAKAAMRAMRDAMFEPFKDKPQVLAVLNQMLAGFLEVDGHTAASSYFDDLSVLVKAQNTGMKPGEIRRSSNAIANPLGAGALKSNTTFEMASAEPAAAKITFVRTTAYDPASMTEFTLSLMKKLMTASGDTTTPAQIDSMAKSIKLSLDERAVFEVEDGMTRKFSEKSVTVAEAMGHSLSRTETRTITVTPAP